MNVRMPDGTLVKNVPEGVTQTELLSMFDKSPLTEEQLLEGGALPGVALSDEDIETIRSGGKISPERTMGEDASKFNLFQSPEPGTQLESFGAGLKRGVKTIGTAGGKALASVTGDEALAKKLEIGAGIDTAESKAVGRDFPLTNLGGEIAGEVAALPLPGAVGKTVAGKVGSAVGVGAVAGTASAAGKNEDIISNALLGAGIGGGIQSLTGPGLEIAKRILNARKGKFKTAEIKELMELGEEFDVDVFTDDALKSPMLKKLSVAAENVPLTGTLKGRLAQGEKQKAAATKVRDFFEEPVENVFSGTQKGLQDKLKTLKKTRAGLFNRAFEKLDPLGSVPLGKWKKAIDGEIAKEAAFGSASDQKLIRELTNFRNAPGGNFKQVSALRRRLSNKISDQFKGSGEALGSEAVVALQKAKEALDQTLNDFAKKSPDGFKTFQRAQNFSRDKISIPFKKGALKSLVNTNKPEQIIQVLFEGGNFSRRGISSQSKQLFNGLDKKGQQAVRAAIINQAFNKASQPGKQFSSATFAGELEKITNVSDVFFKGENRKMIEGLKKIFRGTERAGQVFENPPTGARVIVPGAIGTAVASLGTTIVASASFGATMKLMTQNKTVRNALIGLSKHTPGTKLADQAANVITAVLVREGAIKK